MKTNVSRRGIRERSPLKARKSIGVLSPLEFAIYMQRHFKPSSGLTQGTHSSNFFGSPFDLGEIMRCNLFNNVINSSHSFSLKELNSMV